MFDIFVDFADLNENVYFVSFFYHKHHNAFLIEFGTFAANKNRKHFTQLGLRVFA